MRQKLFQTRAHEVITTDKTGTVDLRGDLADPEFTASLPDCDVVVNCAAVQYVTKRCAAPLPQIVFRAQQRAGRGKSLRTLQARTSFHPCRYEHDVPTDRAGKVRHSQQDGWGRRLQPVEDGSAGVRRHRAGPLRPLFLASSAEKDGKDYSGGFVKMMKKFGFVAFPGRGVDHKIHMVHVIDVASLIYRVAETRASGFFNAADPDPLSIREWIDEIAAELGVRDVKNVSIPLLPVSFLSWMSGYRLLAREQLLMLKLQHVLSIDESLAIGWRPRYSNGRIARDIAAHINRSTDLQAAKKARSLIGLATDGMGVRNSTPGCRPRASVSRRSIRSSGTFQWRCDVACSRRNSVEDTRLLK